MEAHQERFRKAVVDKHRQGGRWWKLRHFNARLVKSIQIDGATYVMSIIIPSRIDDPESRYINVGRKHTDRHYHIDGRYKGNPDGKNQSMYFDSPYAMQQFITKLKTEAFEAARQELVQALLRHALSHAREDVPFARKAHTYQRLRTALARYYVSEGVKTLAETTPEPPVQATEAPAKVEEKPQPEPVVEPKQEHKRMVDEIEATIEETRREMGLVASEDIAPLVRELQGQITNLNRRQPIPLSIGLEYRLKIDDTELRIAHPLSRRQALVAVRLSEGTPWRESIEKKALSDLIEAVRDAKETRAKRSNGSHIAALTGGEVARELQVLPRPPLPEGVLEFPRDRIQHEKPDLKVVSSTSFMRLRKGKDHIVLNHPLTEGRLERETGQTVCGKYTRTDLKDSGQYVDVCATCLDMARRYDIPIPGTKPDPDDPTPRREMTRESYRRDPLDLKVDTFGNGPTRGTSASVRIGFASELRTLSWIARHCVCAHCGADIRDESDITVQQAYHRGGLDAPFPACSGQLKHVIKHGSDLRWQVGTYKNDEYTVEVTVEELATSDSPFAATADIPF